MSQRWLVIASVVLGLLASVVFYNQWQNHAQLSNILLQEQQQLQLLHKVAKTVKQRQSELYTKRDSDLQKALPLLLQEWEQRQADNKVITNNITGNKLLLELQANDIQSFLQLGTDMHFALAMYLQRLNIQPAAGQNGLLATLEYQINAVAF